MRVCVGIHKNYFQKIKFSLWWMERKFVFFGMQNSGVQLCTNGPCRNCRKNSFFELRNLKSLKLINVTKHFVHFHFSPCSPCLHTCEPGNSSPHPNKQTIFLNISPSPWKVEVLIKEDILSVCPKTA